MRERKGKKNEKNVKKLQEYSNFFSNKENIIQDNYCRIEIDNKMCRNIFK